MHNQTTVDDVGRAPGGSRSAPLAEGPVVIEASGLEKVFRIPDQRIDSLKERATHPFTRVSYRELHALRKVSFDVHKGEFFGIVGRNGSGKSTLLKILASIYRADAGRVRMAGRVAPFIELGVGFNHELTARENCVLNGVLMGLTRREASRRLDQVIDFAELHDFVDLKLKNYSSGMMVRLAFAVMVQADADIMLIDEVLAVGDAAFGQKCMDVFHEKRRAGKTIVLVTHDMSTVQLLCHRAMLVHDGELRFIGAPEDAALEYYRLNFADQVGDPSQPPPERTPVHDVNARVVEARLRDATGDLVANVEQGQPIVLDAVLEAARELVNPQFGIQVITEDGVVVFGFTRTLEERLVEGQHVRLSGEIENRLVPGRYYIDCWIRRDREGGDMGLQALRLVHLVVYGTAQRHGVVSLNSDVEAVSEPPPE
jgi:ABC-type polysaccharide/polyol phosphate transport system ATPase subunit